MVERTVETKVLELVEEDVKFCDSCGNPADNAEEVFLGDPDEIYEQAFRNVKREIREHVGNKTHQQEQVGVVGSPHKHSIKTPRIRNREFHSRAVWEMVNKALERAEAKSYNGDLESYHVCDTCKRGFKDTETALAAHTVGDMAEEADSTEEHVSWYEDLAAEIGLGTALLVVFVGAGLVATGYSIGWIFMLLAPLGQLGSHLLLE